MNLYFSKYKKLEQKKKKTPYFCVFFSINVNRRLFWKLYFLKAFLLLTIHSSATSYRWTKAHFSLNNTRQDLR